MQVLWVIENKPSSVLYFYYYNAYMYVMSLSRLKELNAYGAVVL